MPFYNFKFQISNFKLGSAGFTLIEILISISLIALVTVVAVPNFRQLSKDQEINNAAGQLVNILRRAQSSAASHIQCPNNVVADEWSVVMVAASYTLKSQCTAGGSNMTVYTSPYASTSTSSTTFQATFNVCNAGDTVTLHFTNSQATYQCNAATALPLPSSNITITLSGTGLTKPVVIEQGGSIRQ